MMAAADEGQRHEPPVEKMPGHWLLAKMGKRVLRPGGLELTKRLLSDLAVTENDDVVEFAPGLGITARMTLAKRPRSYIAVEREPAAAATVASLSRRPKSTLHSRNRRNNRLARCDGKCRVR